MNSKLSRLLDVLEALADQALCAMLTGHRPVQSGDQVVCCACLVTL